MSSKPSRTYSELLAETEEQLKELRNRIKESQTRLRNSRVLSDFETTRSIGSTEAQVKLEGLKDYYLMRRAWGNFLRICLAVILGFNIVLVYMAGKGHLQFNDEWFLRIVLTTNLADIIGLVYLVVRFLFPNQISETKKAE